MLLVCKNCCFHDDCIRDYAGEECNIRVQSYNKGIDDFVEQITLPVNSEEQVEKIVEKLKR